MNGMYKSSLTTSAEGMTASQYSNIDGDRRITKYVMSQVYVWLVNKIVEHEYQPNKSREGKELVAIIRQKKTLDETQYHRFLELFYNEPFEYIFLRKQLKSSNYITTDKVENYFINYNGATIPVGFVKDFFEDDYETQKDIEEYMDKYVKAEINRTKNNCDINTLKNSSKIEDLEMQYPNVFNTSIVFYITRILCFAMLVLLTSMFLRFVQDIHAWDVMVMSIVNGEPTVYLEESNHTVNGFDYRIDSKYFVWGDSNIYYDGQGHQISAEQAAKANSVYFSRGEYFGALWPALIINTLLFVYLLVKWIRTIKAIIFHIRILYIHQRVAEQKRNCQVCVKVMEDIDAYAGAPDVNAALCKRERKITDEICALVPASVKRFYKRTDNSPALLKIKDQIEKLKTGKFEFMKFFYDSKNHEKSRRIKRTWIVGVVKTIILSGIIFIVNNPIDVVIEPIVDLISNML